MKRGGAPRPSTCMSSQGRAREIESSPRLVPVQRQLWEAVASLHPGKNFKIKADESQKTAGEESNEYSFLRWLQFGWSTEKKYGKKEEF